ncbi:hypothetical protein SD77_2395 [Bacillus badius]|uniref:Ribose 5-phosphate isomerase B n=1 Tax=Bacillus badius TaxID=1455 RepID=A0ABR5AYY0_BACBA|nr:hypothetical protein SD77_2395 [Bacillus badius]
MLDSFKYCARSAFPAADPVFLSKQPPGLSKRLFFESILHLVHPAIS